MIEITKVVEKTIASAIIKAIGEPAMKTFKNPIIEKKLKRDIARTAEHAEKRWIAEYNDDRDLVDAVRQMSLHDLPSIQETLRRLYDHPDDPITIQDFHGKLEENLPKGFNADRIEKAIASYMEILRSELINIEGLREKLNTIANIKTADNTAQIKELIAQLLPKGPEVSTLYDKLIKEKDTDPEKEFARIVDLLLFHETRREGKKIDFPVISDYKGIDNFDVGSYRRSGTTLFHCKFCPSPFSRKHRQDIVKLLKQIIEHQKESRHKKFILVTPQDLSESDEVAWFEGLRK
ncbi:MAG: hypothetical protein GY749_30435, partial [Desulfobacteraceae bacterium]|nr:hypothetical protein [Desulfobacteraceae bacterium]